MHVIFYGHTYVRMRMRMHMRACAHVRASISQHAMALLATMGFYLVANLFFSGAVGRSSVVLLGRRCSCWEIQRCRPHGTSAIARAPRAPRLGPCICMHIRTAHTHSSCSCSPGLLPLSTFQFFGFRACVFMFVGVYCCVLLVYSLLSAGITGFIDNSPLPNENVSRSALGRRV